MNAHHVRPNVSRLTDADARRLLADGIIRACSMIAANGHPNGPSRVALEIGCDEKTVRRARDEESTLGLACTFNLLDVNPGALDALIAAKGFRLARIAVLDGPDVVSASGAALYKIGEARRADSPGGPIETDGELEGMESDLQTLEDAVASLRSHIALAKLRRAA